MDNFFYYIAVSTSSLVMYAHNGIPIPVLYAGADHAIKLLLHFCISALHGIIVKFSNILTLNHRRGRTTSHADAIGGSTYLDNKHPFFRF